MNHKMYLEEELILEFIKSELFLQFLENTLTTFYVQI